MKLDIDTRSLAVVIATLMLATLFAGCIAPDSDGRASLKQTGSSTVLPLAERWADDFDQASVSVSGGGSSHGLNSLLSGEAHLGDASRKISPSDYEKVGCEVTEDEIATVQQGPHPWQYPECDGIVPTEWIVAFDPLTVVVNPSNGWVEDGLTFAQLRQIFTTENTAETWDEVEGLEDAPGQEIQIYAPDEASGTYVDFFELINTDPGASLLAAGSDRYSPSADDNVILNAIANTEDAIGFFGLAYYIENVHRIDAVPIQGDEMEEAITPGLDAGDYPITRPIHIYTNGIPGGTGATSEALRGYISYALSEAGQASVPDVGYVKASDADPQAHQGMIAALE